MNSKENKAGSSSFQSELNSSEDFIEEEIKISKTLKSSESISLSLYFLIKYISFFYFFVI